MALKALVPALLLAVPSTAAAAPEPTAPPAGVQRCVSGGVLTAPGGHSARTQLCASLVNASLTLSAPARCEHSACDASGTYRMTTRNGREVASGPLGTGTEYPGPGSYRVTAEVHARSAAPPYEAAGRWTRTLTLDWPRPAPLHTVTVSPTTVHPNRTTTLTYTLTRRDLRGDSNARLGLIGQENTGVRLSSADPQCSNPLTGAYPSRDRRPHVLDCALTDVQPGHPTRVEVAVRLGPHCSTIVSRMGYWLPQGQTSITGGMVKGPTVTCMES